MARRDNLNLKLLYLLKGLNSHGPKGHHNLSEISLRKRDYLLHIFVIEAKSGMGTKEVTGKENLVFDEIGKHCFRPVKERSLNKPQGFTAKFNCVPIFDYLYFFFRHFIVTLNHFCAFCCRKKRRFITHLQNMGDRTGVIGFCMVHHYIV